jgi:hypothetical protein
MTITIKKRGYWCLRVVYTLCQGLESDGRNFLAAIVRVAGYDIIIVICVIAIEKRQSATYT